MDERPPDPTRITPDLYGPNMGLAQWPPKAVFLKPLVQWPLTTVGEYTYYHDPDDPTGFERNCVLFHFGPERLVIGKYCGLGAGIRFLMSTANHDTDALTTFPFPIFGGAWLEHMETFADRRSRGDTVVGNDVWIGYRVTVMPGVRIGDGAVVAAMSVVTEDVPPYAVVGGNPAKVLRYRFEPDTVARLRRLAWWDWPAETVTAHLPALMSADITALEKAAREAGIDPVAPEDGT